MADFIGTILTNAGRDILTKALAGAKLTFSRIGIGDGVWDNGTNPEQMVSLKDEKKSLPIQELSVVGDGTTRLRFVLTNSGLTEGFFVREIGIFALDPDTQEEKLYAVAYAENPDFIPSDGVTKVESVVDIYTVVSTAQSVTAVISDTVVLATKEDIELHNEDANAHSSLFSGVAKKDLSNVSSLGNILNLDGSGSGLDADTVDGLHASQIKPFTYQIQSADFTCQPKYYYLVDTSSAAVTVTLPASPSDYDVIGFLDLKGTFDVNNLIIAIPSGASYTIMGLAENMTVQTKNMSFELIYYNGDWRIK